MALAEPLPVKQLMAAALQLEEAAGRCQVRVNAGAVTCIYQENKAVMADFKLRIGASAVVAVVLMAAALQLEEAAGRWQVRAWGVLSHAAVKGCND
jgi:uncharacterized membrane protein (DUF2068 family)